MELEPLEQITVVILKELQVVQDQIYLDVIQVHLIVQHTLEVAEVEMLLVEVHHLI